MERDLFKATTNARKIEAQLKTLKDLQAVHGVTHNNTSSAFTLPSEFKTLWDELVTELVLDALPDFLGQYKLIVPLIQELFIAVRGLIVDTKKQLVTGICSQLGLGDDSENRNVIESKLQSVFKDFSTYIFKFTDD